MNRPDSQLREDIERNGTRSFWSALLLLAGLVLELVILLVWSHGDSLAERWSPAAATALIALGVWGEIHFGNKESHDRAELQRRSDVLVAELNLARIELERKYAWRRLTKEQAGLLTSALRGKVAPVQLMSITDPEAEEYGREIADALKAAGIFGGWFTALGPAGRGVWVTRPANGDGELVASALASAGIEAAIDPTETPQTNIHIGGRKRPD